MAARVHELEGLAFSIPQVAAALSISEEEVRILVRRGDLPVMRFGRRQVVSRARLIEWIAEHSDHTFAPREKREGESA